MDRSGCVLSALWVLNADSIQYVLKEFQEENALCVFAVVKFLKLCQWVSYESNFVVPMFLAEGNN